MKDRINPELLTNFTKSPIEMQNESELSQARIDSRPQYVAELELQSKLLQQQAEERAYFQKMETIKALRDGISVLTTLDHPSEKLIKKYEDLLLSL